MDFMIGSGMFMVYVYLSKTLLILRVTMIVRAGVAICLNPLYVVPSL